MKPLSVVVTIDAPASVVWSVLTDLEGTAALLQGVQGIERLCADTGYQVGTWWRETRVMFGQEASEEMTVVEVEPERRTVLHAQPVNFAVDARSGLSDPRDIVGNRLAVDVHVLTIDSGAASAIWRCCTSITTRSGSTVTSASRER